MNDPKILLWELRHEDEVWTSDGEIGQYIGTFENPDYPENSSLAQYVVNMHNTQLDKAQPFDFEKFRKDLLRS